MALPTLTPEQRQAALEKAREARKARSELLAALKAGYGVSSSTATYLGERPESADTVEKVGLQPIPTEPM